MTIRALVAALGTEGTKERSHFLPKPSEERKENVRRRNVLWQRKEV